MLRYQSTYIVKAGDNLADRLFWNTRFQDIDIRLNAVESFTANINVAVDEVTAAGIARIDNILQPAISAAQDEVNSLEAQVATLSALVLSDQNSLTDQLNTLLTTAQTLVNNLEGLGTIDGGTF